MGGHSYTMSTPELAPYFADFWHPPYSEPGVYSSLPVRALVKFSYIGPGRFFVKISASFRGPRIHSAKVSLPP